MFNLTHLPHGRVRPRHKNRLLWISAAGAFIATPMRPTCSSANLPS